MLLSHSVIILSHNRVLIPYMISRLLILWLSTHRAINISRNTNTLFCKYRFVRTYITRTAFLKDLGILIDFKLYVTVMFIVYLLNPLSFCFLFVVLLYVFDLDSLIILYFSVVFLNFGKRWRSWLRLCATRWKLAGSIPDGVFGIFHLRNPYGRTLSLGSTQPLSEMSSRGKSRGFVGLTILPPSCVDRLKVWEPQSLKTVSTCPGL